MWNLFIGNQFMYNKFSSIEQDIARVETLKFFRLLVITWRFKNKSLIMHKGGIEKLLQEYSNKAN